MMPLTSHERWIWMIYALCCGGSDVYIPRLSLSRATLTVADVSAIQAVLRTSYPQPKYDLGSSPEYGFVEILEGTGVRLGGTEDNITLVGSSTYRCRACFDPANSESVEVIVPGYGLCKTRLKDPIRFIPDLESSCVERKQYCDRLDLCFDAIENIGMVMDLLKLLYSGLSELSLRHYEAIQIQVDLSVLAAVCPALHELRIQNFNVVVSTHSEALQTGLLKLFGLTQRKRYRTWCCASKTPPFR
ncbi:hypothetical protein GQ600_9926 [Phytophthora cactorum]|nr:hypothetical protein GQ600_9926 [Phytophthora cactorum]